MWHEKLEIIGYLSHELEFSVFLLFNIGVYDFYITVSIKIVLLRKSCHDTISRGFLLVSMVRMIGFFEILILSSTIYWVSNCFLKVRTKVNYYYFVWKRQAQMCLFIWLQIALLKCKRKTEEILLESGYCLAKASQRSLSF